MDNTVTLPALRESVANFKPQTRSIPMSELRLISPEIIEVDGRNIPLAHGSVSGLCRLLGMPEGFFSKLHRTDSGAWSAVVEAMKRNSDKRMTLLGNNGQVIGFASDMTHFVSHNRVLDFIEEAMAHDESLVLGRQSYFDGLNLNVTVLRGVNIDAGFWKNIPDIFRIGWNFISQYEGGYRFMLPRSVERLTCTNVTYVPTRIGGTYKGAFDPVLLNNFLFGGNASDWGTILRNRTEKMRRTFASVNEVLGVYYMLNGMNLADRGMKIFDTNILRVDEIAHGYGIKTEKLFAKPETWQKTARTPINYYDLYNCVTRAANNPLAKEHEVGSLRIHGGKMLFETPDMLLQAQQPRFTEGDWSVSPD